MSTLEEQVNLLAATYKPVRKAFLIDSILTHHRVVNTDPAILVTALVSWCTDKCTLPRQYWDRVDEVSARVRGRYARLAKDNDKAQEKDHDPDL